MKTFRDLKKGDYAYRIERPRGRKAYAVLEKVQFVSDNCFTALPCYADGTPLIYFSMRFRRSSGIEFSLPQDADRPKLRLCLELPEGIEVLARPERIAA